MDACGVDGHDHAHARDHGYGFCWWVNVSEGHPSHQAGLGELRDHDPDPRDPHLPPSLRPDPSCTADSEIPGNPAGPSGHIA